MKRLGRALYADLRGGVAIILAASLFMLIGAASVSVDLGSAYLAKRQLQGLADAAALAASSGGRTAAEQLITKSGVSGVSIVSAESGSYNADPKVPIANRFVAGGSGATAARLELQRQTPLYFARLLVGKDTIDVRARATAARRDEAAFSLGTGLASLNGGLANALLSSLIGTQINLSVMDYQGLATLNVDLLHFADALRVETGRDGTSYGALFDQKIPLSKIITALGDTAGNSPVAAILDNLALKTPAGKEVRLSDIIDLGPARGAGSPDGQPNILLDTFSMLRMILSPPSGTSIPMDTTVNLIGLGSVRVMMATAGAGAASSPLLSITASRDVILRTAQTRLYLDTKVGEALSGVLDVHIPLYIELASAEARLSAINCTQGSATKGVSLAVTPSVGTISIGSIDTTKMNNFSSPITVQRAYIAQILRLLQLVTVTALNTTNLGGKSPQTVLFSPTEIAAQQPKTVRTQDLAQGLTSSLISQTKVSVKLLDLIELPLDPLISTVGGILSVAAPLLDGLVNSLTSLLGVNLGTATVKVHEMRCGIPMLVA
jgi:uncharacterized membrane protein